MRQIGFGPGKSAVKNQVRGRVDILRQNIGSTRNPNFRPAGVSRGGQRLAERVESAGPGQPVATTAGRIDVEARGIDGQHRGVGMSRAATRADRTTIAPAVKAGIGILQHQNRSGGSGVNRIIGEQLKTPTNLSIHLPLEGGVHGGDAHLQGVRSRGAIHQGLRLAGNQQRRSGRAFKLIGAQIDGAKLAGEPIQIRRGQDRAVITGIEQRRGGTEVIIRRSHKYRIQRAIAGRRWELGSEGQIGVGYILSNPLHIVVGGQGKPGQNHRSFGRTPRVIVGIVPENGITQKNLPLGIEVGGYKARVNEEPLFIEMIAGKRAIAHIQSAGRNIHNPTVVTQENTVHDRGHGREIRQINAGCIRGKPAAIDHDLPRPHRKHDGPGTGEGATGEVMSSRPRINAPRTIEEDAIGHPGAPIDVLDHGIIQHPLEHTIGNRRTRPAGIVDPGLGGREDETIQTRGLIQRDIIFNSTVRQNRQVGGPIALAGIGFRTGKSPEDRHPVPQMQRTARRVGSGRHPDFRTALLELRIGQGGAHILERGRPGFSIAPGRSGGAHIPAGGMDRQGCRQ